jgi:hypothetical protein
MKKKTTLSVYSLFTRISGALALVAIFSVTVQAQVFCANETVLWSENFGTGTAAPSHPDITNLTYQATGTLTNEGTYRIADNTQQKPEWHASANHTTGDAGGKMLVTNGGGLTFYQHVISGPGFLAGSYAASLFLMNINTPGTCSPNPLLPKMTFRVEYNVAASGNTGWNELQSVSAFGVPQSAAPTWVKLGGVFGLPETALRIRLTIVDNGGSGCGNDFAIDDIQFATCPSGGPLPVEFLGINAVQKGIGVNINWSTASELNNRTFEVERSADGNEPWVSITAVNAGGNSSVQRNYTRYDASPAPGYNYYRIKQTDLDGNFRYSLTAKVKFGSDKTGVSVLNNPFIDVLNVDLLGNKTEAVQARLLDMTGRQVAAARWVIAKGRNRKVFDNVSNLVRGIYVFTVTDNSGNVIFNGKLMKQ